HAIGADVVGEGVVVTTEASPIDRIGAWSGVEIVRAAGPCIGEIIRAGNLGHSAPGRPESVFPEVSSGRKAGKFREQTSLHSGRARAERSPSSQGRFRKIVTTSDSAHVHLSCKRLD